MNGRFFHKRAYYLAILASRILDTENGLSVEAFYESRGNDPRLTTLILRPQNGELSPSHRFDTWCLRSRRSCYLQT